MTAKMELFVALLNDAIVSTDAKIELATILEIGADDIASLPSDFAALAAELTDATA